VQVTADQQISLVSGESSYVSTGKSFVVAAAEKLSMFVHKAGMKLLAAKGKVELAAQSDDMRLYADHNMTLTSNQGRVVIEASQELMLKCGGSYIRITPDGIEDGTRGARTVKAASLSKKGPGSVAEHMSVEFEVQKVATLPFGVEDPDPPRRENSYGIVAGDGTVPVWSAQAQACGLDPKVKGDAAVGVRMVFSQGGYGHQESYNHPWTRWALLYSIVQIAQDAPEPSC
jgi:type VI secretion system secreted protein VgrG